jgi:hypothetical protein
MNRLLLVASLLSAATAAIHAFVGGQDTVAPLLGSSLAEEPRLTLYAVLHMATAVMGLSAVALFASAMPRYAVAGRSVVFFISVLWLLFGAVFLAVAATQPGTGLYFKLPQWVLLLPVGVLAWLGANNSFKPTPLRGAA